MEQGGLIMRWSFPSNNRGEIISIGNAGIETFQGTPLRSLAREICQNSLDAALEGKTAEIEFMPFTLDIDEFPDAETLTKAFKLSLEFWSIQSVRKATDFFERAMKMMDSGSIPFLRVSDFNTTGLLGSKSEYNTPWCNLTKSSGASDKTGTSGGSFGIGKFATFACSELRTVFYSTIDVEDNLAFQGISRITSFRRKEDNEITTGTGYYGGKNNQPVYEHIILDPNFKRGKKQSGTDIFIAGFKFYSTDWKENIITSVLDGFLYAVYTGKLIVTVGDITINRDTLSTLIDEYQTSFTENADKYYTVLTSNDTVWYKTDFKNHGLIHLGLKLQSDSNQKDLHRKVAMIRKTGMKIMDRGNISGVIPFAGVMLIEGEKVNDYLRNLENPQHTKWEPDRVGPKEQIPYARAYIRDLITYIKDCMEELKKENLGDEIELDVGEYLPDESIMELKEKVNERESISETIKSIDIIKHPVSIAKTGALNTEEDIKINDSNGDIVEYKDDGSKGRSDSENNKQLLVNITGGKRYNSRQQGEHKSTLVGIEHLKVRIVCLNKKTGEYSITFTPKISAVNGRIDLYLSAESQIYEAPIVSALSLDQQTLTVSENSITGLLFIAEKPIRIRIIIDFYDYCSMEVKAYGNKT